MKTQLIDIWDAGKAVLREKFTVLNAYIRKRERSLSEMNHLGFYLIKLEKRVNEIQSKHKKKKIWVEINEILKTRNQQRKNLIKTKSWFFEKINKINKPLARLRKKERRQKWKSRYHYRFQDIKRRVSIMKNSMPKDLVT